MGMQTVPRTTPHRDGYLLVLVALAALVPLVWLVLFLLSWTGGNLWLPLALGAAVGLIASAFVAGVLANWAGWHHRHHA